MSAAEIMALSLDAGMVLFTLSVLLGFVRLWRGPTLSDRIVALDMMTSAVIGFCALHAVRTGLDAYLDIAVALALVSFVSVLALARYAIRLARRSDTDD